jgi:hypothetical protein
MKRLLITAPLDDVHDPLDSSVSTSSRIHGGRQHIIPGQPECHVVGEEWEDVKQ